MAMDIRVKICGLRRPEHVAAAAKAGAAYVGFVFFAKSPRHLALDDARALALTVPEGVAKVALTVNASDSELDAILNAVAIDMVQLHGGESPERVANVKARYGLPVMKAVGVAGRGDLALLETYQSVADQILVDAKPPKDAALPGGNGLAFDWTLLLGLVWRRPWMLAGGLNAENVAQAVRATNSRQVDVSSGVESAPGIKDSGMIAAFCAAAHGATDGAPKRH